MSPNPCSAWLLKAPTARRTFNEPWLRETAQLSATTHTPPSPLVSHHSLHIPFVGVCSIWPRTSSNCVFVGEVPKVYKQQRKQRQERQKSNNTNTKDRMPFHALPVAIVIAKIGASAVVSLAPVAMSREEITNEDGSITTESSPRFRSFFQREFYEKEFARLQHEKLVLDDDDDAMMINATSSRRCVHRKSLTPSQQDQKQEQDEQLLLQGDQIVTPSSTTGTTRGFFHRKFKSLQHERVE